jgi:hypothetical protein
LDSHREPDGSIAPDDEEDIKGSAGTLLAGNFYFIFNYLLPLYVVIDHVGHYSFSGGGYGTKHSNVFRL